MTQGDSVEIVIERMFDAPRDLVWKAWTDPEHVAQWWGPRGMSARVDELDLRPGGTWRYALLGPNGYEMPQSGVFREVVPPELIVTTAEFEVGMDAPQRMVLAYRFEDLGDKTKLTMTITHASADERREHEAMGVVEGWNSNFDSLVDYIPTLVA